MKDIRYILILLTLCVAVISCERDEVNRYPIEGTGKMIKFSVESEWPTISKAAVNGIDEMVNSMFKVWGTWYQDPSDIYYSEQSAHVFAQNGTYVQIISSGDGVYEGECKSEAEWYAGYYNFAALFPMMFSATHDTEFEKSKVGDATKLEYTNKLNIVFPNIGQNGIYHLGTNQGDLMYAFSNVDNSAETASTVNLNFEHLFSLLTINIAANNATNLPQKVDITIYGIHKSITSPVTITQTEVITNYGTPDQQRTVTTTNNLKDLLKDGALTDETSYYKKGSFTNINYGAADIITPVSQWLVFPENLEETPLKIKVDLKYNDGDVTKTMIATVNTGEWESGKSYAYTLLID